MILSAPDSYLGFIVKADFLGEILWIMGILWECGTVVNFTICHVTGRRIIITIGRVSYNFLHLASQ